MDRAELDDLKRRVAYALMLAAKFTGDERALVIGCIEEALRGAVVVVDSPPNYLGRIDSIWAALSMDAGGEGVCGMPARDGGMLPMIAADEARLEQIVPIAKMLARHSGKPVRLVKFTKREDVETYQP